MDFRRVLAVVVLGALVALTVLADATPPDPVWVTGVYDDGDFDDVVGLIVAGAALAEPPAPAPEPLRPLAVSLGSPPRVTAPGGSASAPNPVRAPPSA
ncbi:MAG TPA: hypothetical protein VGT40_10735 [Methylomirabilota bacterium]|jgi:hypothetical protein|nr:hypothetical protein [Methylomirabilota bacterium]